MWYSPGSMLEPMPTMASQESLLAHHHHRPAVECDRGQLVRARRRSLNVTTPPGTAETRGAMNASPRCRRRAQQRQRVRAAQGS